MYLPNFCVILPMYNEASNAEACIKELSSFLDGVSARTAIIAVNDGSSDGTWEKLNSLTLKHSKLIVANHPENKGYGAANKTAFSLALANGFDYALVMDADRTQRIHYIEGFFEPMRQNVDFIKATRYAKGGGVDGVPFKRWAVSWLGNLFARLVLRVPLTDYTNGFRAIKTELLAQMDCRENGFALLIEEVYQAKKLNATFDEVPYRLTVRADLISNSKFIYSWKVYKSYLKNLFGIQK